MAAEIERKFLLENLPDRARSRTGVSIEQGYLAAADGVEIRLRSEGGRRLLAVKGGAGEVREEVEVGLSEGQFKALWPLTESRRLRKTRYLVPLHGDLVVAVDAYAGVLEGIVTAEVEFGSERESREFPPPGWLGEEVTGDDRYMNRRLALDGRPSVGSEKRDRPSRAYRLKVKEDTPEGLRRIARGRADQALGQLQAAEGAGLAAAIHAARKDLKKLRAVLRLVRDELGKDLFRAENQRYRDAGRLLSGSRDAQVKLETLNALRSRFEDSLHSEDASRRWEEALERERDEIADATGGEAAARIGEAMRAIERGRDRIREWPLRTGSWKLVGPGLSTAYRQGRRAMKRTLAEPRAENVHEWRKRAKDLWYQLRVMTAAWPELLGETADRAHELADLLGDHHDLAVLEEDLASRQGMGDEEKLKALIGRRQEELLASAFEIGERLYAEKPKAFSRRLRRYWLAWREA